MSENLNEMVEVIVQDASVITVPIDDTLSNSGEAADAKAVGDALDLKADRSELQTAVTVNGQAADAQGKIIVTAADTKMSSSDNTTVKAKIEAVDGKTAADIKVSSDPTSQTIAQALSSGATRTADQIEMTASDTTTVKSHIDTLEGSVSNLGDAVTALDNKTAATIKYNTGSDETIKQHIEAMEAGTVKTVNEIEPDAAGNIEISRVPYADNLYSDDGTQVDESFLERTAAGSGSLSDGSAWALRLLGNSVHTGFTPESLTMTVNAIPRTTPPAITVSIDQAAFAAAAEVAGTYEFEYTTDWDVDPEDYGLTVTNDPVNGDKITVTWDGVNDATASVTAGPRTAPPAITATIDRDTFVAYVSTSGTTTLTYTTSWSADPANYGITVTNTPVAGDQIVVVYVKEIRGTITVAEPTALVATGWNLYDHTNGYARVVKYSDTYGYRITGTYTNIAFAETPDGAATTITPDSDGLFNITKDGYILVTGGNSTDTAIWTTWSDWIEGYVGGFQAYAESEVSLAAIMTANFPYGLCKVSTVRDEIDFVHKQAISRITRMAYTAENLETVKAAGRAYEYDEDYIYQVRASEVVNAITVDEEYTVSEHGIEFFAGSEVEIYTEILYGSNLKDKLKRDVVTISPQEMTSGQKAQVRTNIGAAAADLADTVGKILPVITGSLNNSGYAIGAGEYFEANGTLYKATASIPKNNAWSSSATAQGDTVHGALNGGLAELNSNITKLNFVDPQIKLTSSDNMNSVDVGSYYQSGSSMPLNSPSGANNANISVVKIRSNDRFQIWRSVNTGSILYRYTTDWANGSSSNWTSWKELALNDKITNTGAWYELMGSKNANGDYSLSDSYENYKSIVVMLFGSSNSISSGIFPTTMLITAGYKPTISSGSDKVTVTFSSTTTVTVSNLTGSVRIYGLK